MKIEVCENTVWATLFICLTVSLLFLCATAKGCNDSDNDFGQKAIAGGLEQSTVPGSTIPVWVKPKQ